jgi:hypothetical protein
MLKGIRLSLLQVPILKQYCHLVKYIHKTLRILLIKKSGLINRRPDVEYLTKCKQGNCYLYLPWIKSLTGALITSINKSDKYRLISLAIFNDSHTLVSRKKINYFSKYCQSDLVKIVSDWLEPVSNEVHGLVLTFDYSFLQREIIKVCARYNILTILIPHESVFLNREKFYYHSLTGINTPLCDYVLCWGSLHKEIFVDRGYPNERIKLVGAPKFDRLYDFQPKLSHEAFCNKAKLKQVRKKILYAAQTLDFQVNQKKSLRIQRKIIRELIDYCFTNKYGFILRCPPTQWKVIDSSIKKSMRKQGFFIDNSDFGYCFNAEEVIHHVDLVVSINSTMLFEALLMGKKALSVKYFEFEEYWNNAGIPTANNSIELNKLLAELLGGADSESFEITEWAKKSFSPKDFDGRASIRIMNFLETIMHNPIPKLASVLDRIIEDQLPGPDMAYFPSITKNFLYLHRLMNVKRIVTRKDITLIARVDVTLQKKLPSKDNVVSFHRDARNRFIKLLQVKRNNYKISGIHYKRSKLIAVYPIPDHVPNIYIEQGLVSSSEPWLSVILDDIDCYYVANKITRLQTLLNSPQELTIEQESYAELCLKKMVSNKISKYLKRSNSSITFGRVGHKKILLIDECYNDPIIKYGMANEENFKLMLADAISMYPKYDILIQLPINASKKMSKSYYTKSFLIPFLKEHKNIYVLDQTYNTYDIFEQVERVFVVTSLIGFEALMAGIKVSCYGVPFYANRGLTRDKFQTEIRTRNRRLVDIFYFCYVALSRYYCPTLQKKCKLDEFLDLLTV